MSDRRALSDVLSDMEDVHHDIERLALALDAVGSCTLIDVTVGGRYAGAVEVLGEVIGDRAQRLDRLINEARVGREAPAHG